MNNLPFMMSCEKCTTSLQDVPAGKCLTIIGIIFCSFGNNGQIKKKKISNRVAFTPIYTVIENKKKSLNTVITELKYTGSLPDTKNIRPFWHIDFCVISCPHTADAKIDLNLDWGINIPFVIIWYTTCTKKYQTDLKSSNLSSGVDYPTQNWWQKKTKKITRCPKIL